MNICIGVVSYLPEGKLRAIRLEKLNNLLKRCDEVFKLPIIIIAQNWQDAEIVQLSNSKLIVYNYKKGLGITEARRALRNSFLASEFDYLVMLDDDILLSGSQEKFDDYLSQIYAHPNMYGTFKQLTLQLFAISKEVFQLIDYPVGGPETKDFFEDMWLIMALNKLYGHKKFSFRRTGIDAVACATDSVTSTWYTGQDRHFIGDNTRAMIGRL